MRQEVVHSREAFLKNKKQVLIITAEIGLVQEEIWNAGFSEKSNATEVAETGSSFQKQDCANGCKCKRF
jgi:hypothetical protein